MAEARKRGTFIGAGTSAASTRPRASRAGSVSEPTIVDSASSTRVRAASMLSAEGSLSSSLAPARSPSLIRHRPSVARRSLRPSGRRPGGTLCSGHEICRPRRPPRGHFPGRRCAAVALRRHAAARARSRRQHRRRLLERPAGVRSPERGSGPDSRGNRARARRRLPRRTDGRGGSSPRSAARGFCPRCGGSFAGRCGKASSRTIRCA